MTTIGLGRSGTREKAPSATARGVRPCREQCEHRGALLRTADRSHQNEMSPAMDHNFPPIRDPRALSPVGDHKAEGGGAIPPVSPNADNLDPHAQEAIGESEERFRGLAEAIPQMVYVVTAQGDIEYLSQRWREFTGLTHADEASMR
jgi:PAS domain-containing protein